MLMDEEGMQDTANNLIHIGKPIELDEEKFMQQLEELKEYVVTEVCQKNRADVSPGTGRGE